MLHEGLFRFSKGEQSYKASPPGLGESMAKRKRGLDLPPAYEALKKAKDLAGAGKAVQPLHAAPAVADLGDVATAAKPAKKRKSAQAEAEQTPGVVSPSAPAHGQPETPCDGPGAALAAEKATAAAEVSDEQPQRKAKAGKGAPVLPWMRLPVNIEPGTGVALESVLGLDARLLASLHACAPALFARARRLLPCAEGCLATACG